MYHPHPLMSSYVLSFFNFNNYFLSIILHDWFSFLDMLQGHQYETVSGFICESFECIPNKGDKIKVVLETTNADDNQYDEADSGHQEDWKKYQTFELEVCFYG